jgi:dTDP-4-amino-4,6-dideoxygalactose transaminase
MTIPFLELRDAYDELAGEIDIAVKRVTSSGWYIGGSECERFEKAWAHYCDADHCVGLGNGLEALALSLRVLGIGEGDEVIVPSNTYIASWLAVSMAGAIPVPVEPNPLTHVIEAEAIAPAITPRTRGIMPVHLYGHPCPMDEIVDLARSHNLAIVEDAAQAQGASIAGRKIGTHGDLVAWSFYPTKNLGALGDAGAVTTNRADLAERIRLLSNYGSRAKNVHEVKGFNSRLDPIQAAILGVKLAHLDEWNDRRRRIASVYSEQLADCGLILPHVPNWAEPVWHLYVVQARDRDRLASRLADAGVQTLVHYPTPPHLQDAYADMAKSPGSFPIAEQLAKTVLSIPIGPQLSLDQAEQVADAIKNSVQQ